MFKLRDPVKYCQFNFPIFTLKAYPQFGVLFGKATTFLLVVMWMGCSENSVLHSIEDYRARLERVTRYQAAIASRQKQASYKRPVIPERRDRLIPQTDHRNSLYVLLGLTYCEIPQLMAQRNSPLGKVMQPPVSLIYAFDVRLALEGCQANLDQAGAEAIDQHGALLAKLKNQKYEARYVTLWNLTFGSKPMAQYAGTQGAIFDVEGADVLLRGAEAFEQLTFYAQRLLAGTYALTDMNKDAIYKTYQHLEQTQTLGALVNSLIVYAEGLEAANTILRNTSADRFCPQGVPIERVKVLQRVVVKYFAQGVQANIAPIDQAASAYLRNVDTFFALFHTLSAPEKKAFSAYWHDVYGGSDALWGRYRDAVKTHASLASALLEACGLGVR